jgi:uncharacterized membrane protein (TIGR02234 family)
MASKANPGRREFGLTLAAGVVGVAIVLLAAGQPWARASFAPAPPLPTSSVTVTGHELMPAADALALAALACLAAVIATRGAVRRVTGLLLALLGVLIAAAAPMSVGHAHVAAAAVARSLATAAPPHLAMAAFPWWAAAAVGGLVIGWAGAVAAWRGTRWPAMSAKYDRPGGPPRAGTAAKDPAATWDALDRGADPTLDRGGDPTLDRSRDPTLDWGGDPTLDRGGDPTLPRGHR